MTSAKRYHLWDNVKMGRGGGSGARRGRGGGAGRETGAAQSLASHGSAMT